VLRAGSVGEIRNVMQAPEEAMGREGREEGGKEGAREEGQEEAMDALTLATAAQRYVRGRLSAKGVA